MSPFGSWEWEWVHRHRGGSPRQHSQPSTLTRSRGQEWLKWVGLVGTAGKHHLGRGCAWPRERGKFQPPPLCSPPLIRHRPTSLDPSCLARSRQVGFSFSAFRSSISQGRWPEDPRPNNKPVGDGQKLEVGRSGSLSRICSSRATRGIRNGRDSGILALVS